MKRLVLLFAVMLQTAFIFAQGRSSSSSSSTSEVFIEIPERGNYVVYLDEDFAGSSKGRFRFYDVYRNSPTLVVKKDSVELFRRRINVSPNTRMILSYSKRSGLRNLVTLPIFDRGQYALDDWDRSFAGNGAGFEYEEAMTDEEFKDAMGVINNEMFPKNKLTLAKTTLKNSRITTGQLLIMMKAFPFDEEKIDLAHFAYPYVTDHKNYIKVPKALMSLFAQEDMIKWISKQ